MRGVWGLILLTILAFYLFSFIVIKLPFFDIREYSVVGITNEEKNILKNYLNSLGKRIIFLPERFIYEDLNHKYGNRFKSISIKREFTKKGIIIDLYFNRRDAIAVVKLKKRIYLIDENGTLFIDKINKKLPIIEVNNLYELKSIGKKVANLAYYSDKIIILEDKVIIQTGKVKYILPSIKLITEKDIKVLRYALRQNFNAKVIDLRYKKFILLR